MKKKITLLLCFLLLLSFALMSCDESEPLPEGVSSLPDILKDSLVNSDTGKTDWPTDLLPEGFPKPNYTEIYSAERIDNEVTIILFGEYAPPTKADAKFFMQKLLTTGGYIGYQDAETGERIIVNKEGFKVSIAESGSWTGTHLETINKESPTGYTFEIKVVQIGNTLDCLFWQFPDASADLGLESIVFDKWPSEYLPEKFPKPNENLEILEMKQDKNGVFITVKGCSTDMAEFQNEIYKNMGYINTLSGPEMNTDGEYMFTESIDYQYSGNAGEEPIETLRFQICPANDLIKK